jgi:SAM-dependent methyltransferase
VNDKSLPEHKCFQDLFNKAMSNNVTDKVLGIAGYGANAAVLAEQYESISFADVHRDVIHLFPDRPSAVLDIGAGSGRDASALVRQGHHVVAVEPTAELRDAGQRIHSSLTINWVDDHLPALTFMRQTRQRFDLILLTAVWMHLDESERKLAMEAITDLVAEEGQVIMSLRHGPVPPGRRMFDVSAEETIKLGAQFGLHAHHHSQREGMFDRADVSWSLVALRRT